MREKIIEILNEICPGNDFENETAIIDGRADRAVHQSSLPYLHDW